MATKAGGKKTKCKYWGKCFRKDPAHKSQFYHPDDSDIEDDSDDKKEVKYSNEMKGSRTDLRGKRVVFTGKLSNSTRNQAEARARVFGCIVVGSISKKTDVVVIGEDAGSKEDKAKELGLKCLTEDDWEEILSGAKPVRGYRASERNKDAAQASDSDDDDFDPALKKKKVPAVKKKTTDAEDNSDAASPKQGDKRKSHDISDSEDEDKDTSPKKKLAVDTGASKPSVTSSDDKPKKKNLPKCKYWDKCYQKGVKHQNAFIHPSDQVDVEPDEPDEPMEASTISDKTDAKLKKTLKDGESHNLDIGCDNYNIKRTGNDYYCSCDFWKSQDKPVGCRTCKHLMDYLGDDAEDERVKKAEDDDSRKSKRTKVPAGADVKLPSAKMVQVLLAHKYDEDRVDPVGWWVSEKLDGVRAFWNGKKFYSRLGNEFIAPPWFIKDFPRNMWLDGELFGGRGKFQSTISIVKSRGSDRWKDIKFMVFDAPHLAKIPFEDRMDAIKQYFTDNKVDMVHVVEQVKCTSKQMLNEGLKHIIKKGGEGLMIRQPQSKYENGRSHTLLKIKKFYDAEARVVGYEPGKGNNTGLVGALVCVMACGKQFKVGSGLTNKDRKKPPKIGSIITYKFQELTNSGSPRFPSFLGVPIDKTEPKDAEVVKKPTD